MVADARQAFVERDRKLDFKAKTKSISSNNHGSTMEDLTWVWKTGWPSSAENDKISGLGRVDGEGQRLDAEDDQLLGAGDLLLVQQQPVPQVGGQTNLEINDSKNSF